MKSSRYQPKATRGAGGGGGKMNPNDLMRQVQRMQEEMARIQGETTQEVITVSSGGGMVEVSITGGLEVQGIKIKPEVVDPDDVEMLQDLILAAVNEAIQKAQELMEGRMSALTGGMGIPGLM
ncbi:MAG: YbaB/EbfC family nucleoid-associated protein [Anaerolineae bacterium]|nr:YbaB/EbfC family nucleoid-associated protein [Anaerolineae bacterium]